MPRRRKFNLKRHACGQIKKDRTVDHGSELLLKRRAERFGEKNARDPLSTDTDIIGNLLLAKKISREQHEALTKASDLYRNARTLRSMLWMKVNLELPDCHVSSAPRLTPKTSSFGQAGRTLDNVDYELCENRLQSLNKTILYLEQNLDRAIIKFVAYNETPNIDEDFFSGVNWLVGHFQKAPRRRTLPGY